MLEAVTQSTAKSLYPLVDRINEANGTGGVDAEHLSRFRKEKCALELRCSELETKVRQLKRLALTDDFTGLANRRYFDSALDEELRRMSRTNLPLTVPPKYSSTLIPLTFSIYWLRSRIRFR
jgi:hypothetical protein